MTEIHGVVLRQVDERGRIVIPRDARLIASISGGEVLVVNSFADRIVLRKAGGVIKPVSKADRGVAR